MTPSLEESLFQVLAIHDRAGQRCRCGWTTTRGLDIFWESRIRREHRRHVAECAAAAWNRIIEAAPVRPAETGESERQSQAVREHVARLVAGDAVWCAKHPSIRQAHLEAADRILRSPWLADWASYAHQEGSGLGVEWADSDA